MRLKNEFLLEHQDFVLIPFETKDEDLFHTMNTDPFIRKYLWDNEVMPRDTSREILAKNEAYFLKEGFGLWKIQLRKEKEPVGYTGLWYFFNEPQPQLLYVLKKEFTGRGIATEVCNIIIDYAFSRLGFNYLLASTDEPNLASQKVAERIGMKKSGVKQIDGKSTIFYRINKN